MLELRSGTSDRSYLTANVGAATTIFHSHTKRFETTTDGVKITGGLQDKDGQLGTSGQVLSSTGTELNWVPATSGQKGEKGEKGIKGEDNSTKGQKGDAQKGEKGQKGQDGADNSTKGQKGQKGEVGAQGVGGSAGNPGDKGQKGEVGTTTKGQKGEVGNITAAIPSGGIILWSGAANAIPSGWYLCNGSNGTPNLSGKFVVGYSASDNDFDVGDNGGSKDATLVSHSHTVNSHTHGAGSLTATNTSLTGSINRISESFGDFGGSASGVFSKVGGLNAGGTPGNPDTNNCGGVNFNGSHTHDVSGSTASSSPGTNSQGSSASNANLPPYYALCYIMKA